MQSTIKKISLLVLFTLLIPTTIFFIFQFSSLNQSEKELTKIYTQQLEAILFSVNQYSEDILSSWSNDLIEDYKTEDDIINIFIRSNPAIKIVFLTDTTLNNIDYLSEVVNNNKKIFEEINLKLVENRNSLRRILGFLEKGYKKIEPIGGISNDSLYMCLFPIGSKENGGLIGGIVFSSVEFISQNLGVKLARAGGDEFLISVSRMNSNSIIYSTQSIDRNEVLLEKPLWLLPGMNLGISIKTGSLQEIVSQRFYTNIFVLIILLFILLAGLALIYYNIRKELKLTQLKSDFVANVSHELRTPLALISMYSETLTLNRIKSEEKKSEYYSIIHSEANRLSNIVNSILNFSKMESQTRKYNFGNFRLEEISNDVIDTYSYHIKSHGFKYKIESVENLDDIYVDRDAVSESMINLIDNAMKYSKDQKEFVIRIGENKIGQFWEIKDFGVGISPSDQKRIFNKFYRVSSGLVQTTKGTGLGLTLVQQIMNAHDGDISVKSNVNQGSIFKLQFKKEFRNN